MFYSQLDLTIAMEVGGVIDGLNEINLAMQAAALHGNTSPFLFYLQPTGTFVFDYFFQRILRLWMGQRWANGPKMSSSIRSELSSIT